MTLKNAALLALVGMVLVTLVELMSLIRDISLVVNGAVAAWTVVHALIFTFASVAVTILLYVFYRSK